MNHVYFWVAGTLVNTDYDFTYAIFSNSSYCYNMHIINAMIIYASNINSAVGIDDLSMDVFACYSSTHFRVY